MKIYIEFKKAKLRALIEANEIEVAISPNFYMPIANTEPYYMFRDEKISNQLKDFIERHRSRLSVFRKMRHLFFRNTVYSLVDSEVQNYVTAEQIFAYAELVLDARVNWIIKKPENFDSTSLINIENIKHTYINRGKIKGDIVMSKI